MEPKRKHLISIILIATLCLLALFTVAACGDNGSSGKTSGSGELYFEPVSADGSASDRPKAETFTVTVNNEADGVSLKVGYVGDDMQPRFIQSGDCLEKDTVVFARVNGVVEGEFVISAYVSDALVDEKVISSEDAESEQGLFGLALTGNMTIVLKRAPKPVTITIKDGAKGSSTKEAVNALHVYDPDIRVGNDEYSDGDVVLSGRKVRIFVFNYATPVRLTITYKGVVEVDKIYPIVTDQRKGHDEFFNYVLDGDLEVVTEAVEDGE